MKVEDKVPNIVKSIVRTTSIALLDEDESDFMKAIKKAESCGKCDAFMKLVLFEIEHNLEEHIRR